MPDINPSLPEVGQPNANEDPKIITALTQLIAAVNDVDSAQIADGTIAVTDLTAALQTAFVPVGSILATAAATADSGFVMCDGSAISRTTYALLFDRIGENFGAGDGATTFNVPDLRGRVPLGVGTATGATGATAHTLGQEGGEETHTITTEEVPTNMGVNRSGTFLGWLMGNQPIPGVDMYRGGGGAHNNLQPYVGVNYQIKI